MTRKFAALLGSAVLPVVVLLSPGCANGGGDGVGSTTPAPIPTASAGTPTGAAPTGSPGGGTSDWTSGPLVVQRQVPVPPVPTIVGIRSAAHSAEGYDRVVFDITGPLPGYELRYVDEPVLDPSGLPANVPGRRFLQITLRPAQAHNDAGVSTVTPRSRTIDYPMLEAYAITGDFEGVVTVVLGLDDVVGYRVGELSGRIYLDVAA